MVGMGRGAVMGRGFCVPRAWVSGIAAADASLPDHALTTGRSSDGGGARAESEEEAVPKRGAAGRAGRGVAHAQFEALIQGGTQGTPSAQGVSWESGRRQTGNRSACRQGSSTQAWFWSLSPQLGTLVHFFTSLFSHRTMNRTNLSHVIQYSFSNSKRSSTQSSVRTSEHNSTQSCTCNGLHVEGMGMHHLLTAIEQILRDPAEARVLKDPPYGRILPPCPFHSSSSSVSFLCKFLAHGFRLTSPRGPDLLLLLQDHGHTHCGPRCVQCPLTPRSSFGTPPQKSSVPPVPGNCRH